MIKLDEISIALSLWFDSVARTLGAGLARRTPNNSVEFLEEDDGWFIVNLAKRRKGKTAGLKPLRLQIANGAVTSAVPPAWLAAIRAARVEMILRPSRFLFRPLDLPKRAAEFLNGIVRAQIDRLTPWNDRDAFYHWTNPQDISGERISMTVVAAARTAIAPLTQAVADLGATAISVSTLTPGPDGARITIYSREPGAAGGLERLRFGLRAVFVATTAASALSFVAGSLLSDSYNDQERQIQRRIAERRAELRAESVGSGTSALDLLERRKHETPSSVMVIEALSSLLPDHTYATELRTEGDKLQIVGVTRDAPSLIPLLEQSPHFAHATFFAPTTRAPNESGESFHIEAQLRPYFGPGS